MSTLYCEGNDFVGLKSIEYGMKIVKETENEKVIALAGNPNVGKSTVFNLLTGMNQHTGNWPGKTVSTAIGKHTYDNVRYNIVDLPGTYSLMAHSAEEEVARDFICFGGADAVVVVCDATCLERNLNLVMQTLEITQNVVVCVNLMDEARKKKIHIDLDKLQELLGVPVVGMSARSEKRLDMLMKAVSDVCLQKHKSSVKRIRYLAAIEDAVSEVEPVLQELCPQDKINTRWLALRLIDYDETLVSSAQVYLGVELINNDRVARALKKADEIIKQAAIEREKLRDRIVSCLILMSEEVSSETVESGECRKNRLDRRLDKILTSKITGIPIMLALLCVVFWLTITGANYPSELLSRGLFWVQDRLTDFFMLINAPDWLHGMLVLGVYRVLAWVVSVMLPPMAIFFPLFTLLEDFGYLPRVAFNLDHYFKKASACGKQSLTMCMGFGCNAAGVVGCRIIDSPRERLIAIITNSFVPCNGRFPTLISIISMFFVTTIALPFQSIVSTMILLCVVLMGIIMTFWVSKLLSKTLLKGMPSSFTLELPQYRRPQIGKVIVRSIFDRTLFVLGRAVIVAAPAGLILWIMANVTIGDATILAHCSEFLDPFGRLLGLDGVIILAFILGFPANEIVVPIIIMTYMATGTITDMASLTELKSLLLDNGWTWVTAISMMLFCLFHWPCSTTCMTIGKETKSFKWTIVSFLAPTVVGIVICFAFNSIVKLIGIV